MIVPVKCFTCGNLIGDKYPFYQREVRKRKVDAGIPENKVIYLTKNNVKKTPEAEVLDELDMKNMCCRRHFLTHVDLE